jgi:sigma-E factor negative regulatory protein RseA
MSDSKKRLTESVSALVDGEVSELELHRILKELELEGSKDLADTSAETVKNKWSRYNRNAQAMVNTPLAGKDISQSVSAAIAREKSHTNNVIHHIIQANSLRRFAVAASVAFMAIVGVQQLNNTSPMQNEAFQAATSSENYAEQLQRPANQFPSGFQPMIEARTVNAGGAFKTSLPPSAKLIKLYVPSTDAKASQLDLKSIAIEDQAVSETESGDNKQSAEDSIAK